ncbi:MAG: methylenetetrahydrofolate reductase [Acidimicrobiia bacterium]|nr:methylenetetrahydrofolate reductase [Acidimicrobiia bacterium]
MHELLAAGQTFSFEFGPPRTEQAERTLEKTLVELEPLAPSFVSVTYGAGGSTRDKTREIVEHIHRDTSMAVMPHLTCVAHTRGEITEIVEGYRDQGIASILALAGDPPLDGGPVSGDFRYAIELIELVRELGDFSIGVAAHPELHPRSAGDRAADRRHLAAKLARADFGITNLFFRATDYLTMVDELDALGVRTPVLPGIIPVTNVAQVERFATLSGAAVPAELADRLHAVADRPEEVRRIGVDVAAALTAELLERGAPGVHFYTLNFSRATKEIYAALGKGPAAST